MSDGPRTAQCDRGDRSYRDGAFSLYLYDRRTTVATRTIRISVIALEVSTGVMALYGGVSMLVAAAGFGLRKFQQPVMFVMACFWPAA